MSIKSRPDCQRCISALILTFLVLFGSAPIHAGAAVNDSGASAIAALDAIPAGDWVKQSSGTLLDRVITASSKESLDAAAAKDPRAQALVGSAHLSGLHGYAKSESEAVKFYRLAAHSNPIAQNNLGNLLLSGVANGGKPAPAEAAEMFRRAAKLGHPVAQANLGKLYADGVGLEKDAAKAKEFLSLAAAQGNADAKNLLDTLKAREEADAEAQKWMRLEESAATDDANALRELAKAYEEIARTSLDFIKTNQLQAAVNAITKARDPKKVPIDKLADEHGMTALHWAVSNRNAAAMRWLLDKGAELELKDDQGRTPLKIALDNQDTRAINMLIDRGARTSTALPGHDDELKALKKNEDVIDFMIWAAAVDATDTPAAAAALYHKACSTKQPNTCLKLGVRHYRGDGVPKDLAKAAELYRTACDADAETVEACHWLAGLHMTGEGVPKDAAKAVTLYTKACDGGYLNGCYMLGLYYTEGKALAKDDAKAVALFTKACNALHVRACTSLGYMYQNGQGVTKDVSKAAAFYRKACSTGEPNACINLGLMYNTGEGVPKDQAKVAELYRTACDAGGETVQACHWLATRYMNGEGVPKDTAKAVALNQKACDGKYEIACTVLGSYFYLGKDLPRDWPKAAVLFERACDGDRANACYMLGVMYREGEGIAPDKTKAAALLAKACKLGEQKACTAQSAAAPATAAPAATAPAATRPAAAQLTGTNCQLVKVVLGVDTVASVERDIKARGGSPSVGGGGHGKHTINSLSGDYSDGGPAIMAVNYDFDAAAPTSKLVAVTVVRKVDFGAPYAKLLADRKAFLTTAFGNLKPKSATESTGSRPGCTLALFENPDTGLLYELYKLAN